MSGLTAKIPFPVDLEVSKLQKAAFYDYRHVQDNSTCYPRRSHANDITRSRTCEIIIWLINNHDETAERNSHKQISLCNSIQLVGASWEIAASARVRDSAQNEKWRRKWCAYICNCQALGNESREIYPFYNKRKYRKWCERREAHLHSLATK